MSYSKKNSQKVYFNLIAFYQVEREYLTVFFEQQALSVDILVVEEAAKCALGL
jgi:hypothetical protein